MTTRRRRLLLPVFAGVLLVGCSEAAANQTSQDLQDLEQRIIDADPEDANVSDVLADTYMDVSELAAHAEGELGDALTDLQPLLEKLGALTGDDEQAALEAKEELAELSEDQISKMDDAANFVNETCELSVLL